MPQNYSKKIVLGSSAKHVRATQVSALEKAKEIPSKSMAQQFGTRYRGLEMKRVSLAILLALSTMLAGCFGGGETVIEESAEETPI